MASSYSPTSQIFKDLNSVNLVAYNIATAIWGANMCNSVIFAFTSKDSFRIKLLVAWLWAGTTLSQGLTTAQMKKDYVLWGFITPDSAIKADTVPNITILISCLISTSSQSFLVYEIWKHSRSLKLIPIFATPPILFQIAFSLGSLVTPSSSSWNFYRKDMLLASILVNTIFNTLIYAALCAIFWPRYFSVMARKESTIPFVLNIVLFTINTNFWVVLMSISNIAMFYFLYSYTSLFALYSHMTTPVYFLTILSFLDSRSEHAKTLLNPSEFRAQMAVEGGGEQRTGMGGLRFREVSQMGYAHSYDDGLGLGTAAQRFGLAQSEDRPYTI